jgi:hypothetical protein
MLQTRNRTIRIPSIGRSVSCGILLLVLGLVLSPHAAAQTETVGAQANPLDEYLDLRLEEDTDRIRRVRIALLTMTGAFAAGSILNVTWGALNCESNGDEFSCDTSKQRALSGVGAFFSGVGAIGMLTTGIMLGVRNRQKRQTEELIRQKRQRAHLHFDVESGSLRF